MIYLVTATEINFIKELLEQLSGVADTAEYTEREVEEALEILNSLKPIKTEDYLSGEDNDRSS